MHNFNSTADSTNLVESQIYQQIGTQQPSNNNNNIHHVAPSQNTFEFLIIFAK
jgi:hypothetical protein